MYVSTFNLMTSCLLWNLSILMPKMSLELLNVNRFINLEKDQFHLSFLLSLTSCRCLLPARWTEGLSLMFTDGTGTLAVCRSLWIPLVFLYL